MNNASQLVFSGCSLHGIVEIEVTKLVPVTYLVQILKGAVKLHIHGDVLKANSFGLHALFPIKGPLVLLQPWSQSDGHLLASATKLVHEVKCGFLLDIVVQQRLVII